MLIGQRPPGPLAKLGARRMGKFDGDRFKTQLKLARCRLENLLKQNRNMTGGRRREIATLLQQGQEDRARVNVCVRRRGRVAFHSLGCVGQISDPRRLSNGGV